MDIPKEGIVDPFFILDLTASIFSPGLRNSKTRSMSFVRGLSRWCRRNSWAVQLLGKELFRTISCSQANVVNKSKSREVTSNRRGLVSLKLKSSGAKIPLALRQFFSTVSGATLKSREVRHDTFIPGWFWAFLGFKGLTAQAQNNSSSIKVKPSASSSVRRQEISMTSGRG